MAVDGNNGSDDGLAVSALSNFYFLVFLRLKDIISGGDGVVCGGGWLK